MHSFAIVLIPDVRISEIMSATDNAMEKAIERGWPGDRIDYWNIDFDYINAVQLPLPVSYEAIQTTLPFALVTPDATFVMRIWDNDIPSIKKEWKVTYNTELNKYPDMIAVCVDYHS